jgi:hypothetical protein
VTPEVSIVTHLNVKLPDRLQDRFSVHPNGGGFIAPGTKISDGVYVGPDSIVMGGSYIGDNVRIDGQALVVNCTLSGPNANAINIHGGYLCGAKFYDTDITVKDSELTNVKYQPGDTNGGLAHERSVTIDSSVLKDAELSGLIVVNFGLIADCTVEDSTIAGYAVTAVPSPHGHSSTGTVKDSTITTTAPHIIGSGSGNFTIDVLTDVPIPA